MQKLTAIKLQKLTHKNGLDKDDNELLLKNDYLMTNSLISTKDIFTCSDHRKYCQRVGDVASRISNCAKLSSGFDE